MCQMWNCQIDCATAAGYVHSKITLQTVLNRGKRRFQRCWYQKSSFENTKKTESDTSCDTGTLSFYTVLETVWLRLRDSQNNAFIGDWKIDPLLYSSPVSKKTHQKRPNCAQLLWKRTAKGTEENWCLEYNPYLLDASVRLNSEMWRLGSCLVKRDKGIYVANLKIEVLSAVPIPTLRCSTVI